MSMSVIGILEPDDEWELKRNAYNACVEAGVEPPVELERYFYYGPPDPLGIRVNLKDEFAVERNGDMTEGFIVKLSELPDQVTHIHFYCSW